MKAKLYLVMALLGLVALLTGACTTEVSAFRQMPEEFLRNSPTFTFDSIEDTLRLADTLRLRCPYCWVFILEFHSRHTINSVSA
ncbi:hypothetical protein ACFLX1_02285 [Chloroflexota bacterium]